MNCLFERTTGGWRCGTCGFLYPFPDPTPPLKTCRAGPIPVSRAAALSRDIEALILNRQANRTAVEIERCLALCRRPECRDKFLGYGCRDCTCKLGPRAWINGLARAMNGQNRWNCPQWDES